MQRLREVIDDKFPGNSHLVPSEDEIDISKLGHGATVTTDTCNAAQKLRRILTDLIPGVCYEYDCMHHLRNVWFGNMEEAFTKTLNAILRSDLDLIDPNVRVTALISAIIRAIDKDFSLSANYPKDHGELFCEWTRKKYPGKLLPNV